MTDVVAAVLLTYAVATGVASMATGAFFTRSSFPLPFSGLIAAIVTLFAYNNAISHLVAVVAAVFCGFVSAATWAAGPDS